MKYPDQKTLKKYLSYCPDSGLFTWKKFIMPSGKRNSQYAGKKAGGIRQNGRLEHYRRIMIPIEGKYYYAHILAWIIVNNEEPKGYIDHINGDATDNKIKNIRVVSRIENGKNLKKSKANKSGVTGVSWHKNLNKWVANITVERKRICLGYFKSIDEACQARYAAEIKYGFHPNHGKR